MFRFSTLACVCALAVCGFVWGGTKANSRSEVRVQNEVAPPVDATKETADAFVTAITAELSRRSQPPALNLPDAAAPVTPVPASPRDVTMEKALSYSGPGVLLFTPSEGTLVFGRNDNLMSPWFGFDLRENEAPADDLDLSPIPFVEIEGTLALRFEPATRVLHVTAVSDENNVFERDFDLSPKLRRDGVEASASYVVSFFSGMSGVETAVAPFAPVDAPDDASTMAGCSCQATSCKCSITCEANETAQCRCREKDRCSCVCLLN